MCCTTLYQYALHIQYPPCVINMHYTYHVLCNVLALHIEYTMCYQYALHIPCVMQCVSITHRVHNVLSICTTHTVRNVLSICTTHTVRNVLSICTTHTVRNVLTYQYALHSTQYTLCVKHNTYSMPRVISATDLYGVLADSQSVP